MRYIVLFRVMMLEVVVMKVVAMVRILVHRDNGIEIARSVLKWKFLDDGSRRPIMNREILTWSRLKLAEYPRSNVSQENVGVGKGKCQVRGARKGGVFLRAMQAKERGRTGRSRRGIDCPS